jgi:hypothetical protein
MANRLREEHILCEDVAHRVLPRRSVAQPLSPLHALPVRQHVDGSCVEGNSTQAARRLRTGVDNASAGLYACVFDAQKPCLEAEV